MIPHSWKAPSAHPQAPVCLASTSQLDPEGRAPYISGPDSQIYQFHGPLSCQIKIFLSVHRRSLTPISEWHNLREEDRSPHVNTLRKDSLHGHHHHSDKERGNLTDRQQPQSCDVHIVDTPPTKLLLTCPRFGKRCIPDHQSCQDFLLQQQHFLHSLELRKFSSTSPS